MHTPPILWQLMRDPTDVAPKMYRLFEWVRAAGSEPRLIATTAGEQALLVPCQSFLEALAMLRSGKSAGDQAGLERYASQECGNCLAIFDIAPGPEVALLVQTLVQTMAEQGKVIGIVGLREADPSTPLAVSGLEPITGAPIDAPDAPIRLYHLVSSDATPRKGLVTGRPTPEEGPRNLEGRSKWFQSRTGRGD